MDRRAETLRLALEMVDGSPTAGPKIVARNAQALAEAIDGMLWAAQSKPEFSDLRSGLASCKAKLRTALESVGYTLRVEDGFRTKVTKIRTRRSRPRVEEPSRPPRLPGRPPQPDGLEEQWSQEAVEPKRHRAPKLAPARIAARIIRAARHLARTKVMTAGYTIEATAAAGPCLACGMEVTGAGFRLAHAGGAQSSPYCSKVCATQDADADILGDGFDSDEEMEPLDEPR